MQLSGGDSRAARCGFPPFILTAVTSAVPRAADGGRWRLPQLGAQTHRAFRHAHETARINVKEEYARLGRGFEPPPRRLHFGAVEVVRDGHTPPTFPRSSSTQTGARVVKRALIIVATVAAVLPAAAAARRGVSGSQKAAIVHAVSGTSVPVVCDQVFVSTISRFWATVEFGPTRGYSSFCQQYGSNGVTILHHVRARWRVVGGGSSIRCPVPGLPRSIERDLQLPCQVGSTAAERPLARVRTSTTSL